METSSLQSLPYVRWLTVDVPTKCDCDFDLAVFQRRPAISDEMDLVIGVAAPRSIYFRLYYLYIYTYIYTYYSYVISRNLIFENFLTFDFVG